MEATHEVFNQALPRTGNNLFDDNAALRDALAFNASALDTSELERLGAKLANMFHPRYTVSFGMAIAGLGLYMLMHLDPTMTSIDFVLPLILFGAGLGLGMAPLTNAATTSVPLSEVGMSSGLLNLTRNIGGAFGIAIFSTILTSATNANVLMVAQNSHIIGSTTDIISTATALIIMKAQLLAYGTVFGYAAAAMVGGALIAFFFLRVSLTETEVPPEVLAEAQAGG